MYEKQEGVKRDKPSKYWTMNIAYNCIVLVLRFGLVLVFLVLSLNLIKALDKQNDECNIAISY